jgi:hypothetical protein
MKLLLLTAMSLAISLFIIFYSSNEEGGKNIMTAPTVKTIHCPVEHQRPADQTFLTYPEWFLVYSPDEFAAFLKTDTPDRFPFFGHIGQFWQGYRKIYGFIKEKYAFNFGYHVMIMVIGTSTTVEYALRACYEKVIGKLSKLTSSASLTDEDRFAALVAQEYVDFIKVRPWYEFNFKSRLKRLWSLPATGENMIRKWERRYILTTDLAVKTLYGWLIGKMTKASYDEALTVTAVVIDRVPDAQDLPLLKKLDTYADGSALILLPRYDAFKNDALSLAKQNIKFREIAGNDDVIMVTYLVPQDFEKDETVTSVLFVQPILTNPSLKRIALIVPINSLSEILVHYHQGGITLEHVYDF